jgi:nucleoside-diphosphate-sugar epimerase
MKRVVVTGASGFIGRNVLLRAPRDWQITAVYHRSAGLEAFVAAHGLSRVAPVRCDLTNPADVETLAHAVGGRADAVLYLAANGDPAASVERPRWDLESNSVALVNFLEHCPVDHMVYVSSGAVYDGLVGPVSPSTAVSPSLPYAISKLASEQYVRFFAERRRAIGSYINVRFFGAYGPYEPLRKITTRWMRAVMDGQRQLTIRGDGENLIDFMYVDDAVDGFLALTDAAGASGTVDFASGAPISVNEVVRLMARTLGVEIALDYAGHTDEYIRFRTVDAAVAERFGVRPTIPFADGIARLHRFLASEAV